MHEDPGKIQREENASYERFGLVPPQHELPLAGGAFAHRERVYGPEASNSDRLLNTVQTVLETMLRDEQGVAQGLLQTILKETERSVFDTADQAILVIANIIEKNQPQGARDVFLRRMSERLHTVPNHVFMGEYEQKKQSETMPSIQLAKVYLSAYGVRVSKEAYELLPEVCRGDYPSTDGLQSRISQLGQPDQWVTVKDRTDSPYELVVRNGSLFYNVDGDLFECKVFPNKEYRYTDNRGKDTHLGWAHVGRIRISPVEGCASKCTYCPLPFVDTYNFKRDSLETMLAAIEDASHLEGNNVDHCLISGGTPHEEDYDAWDTFVIDISNKSPVPVTLMAEPRKDPNFLRRLAKEGNFERISLNLEIYDDDKNKKSPFNRIIPTKRNLVGLEARLENLRLARELFPKEVQVTSILLVGESVVPTENVLRGVEALAKMGVQPVLSPFKPDGHTPLAHAAPPTPNELLHVYKESEKILNRYGMTLEIATHPGDAHNTLAFNSRMLNSTS